MKRLPFWLVCTLILLGAPVVGWYGGYLLVRLLKDGQSWKELPGPPDEQITAIWDATITYTKELRLCVNTQSGAVYLWQKHYLAGTRFDPDGPQCWHLLARLPDGQGIRYLRILGGGSEDEEPLLVVKSTTGQTFAWQSNDWHPIEKLTRLGHDWALEWPSEGETTPRLLHQTNNVINADTALPLAARVSHGEFRSWFTLPKPPGKVVDEVKLSFEGALSDWVSCYTLLEDGRLFLLATERDLADVIVELAGAAVGFVVAIVLLIALGRSRKADNAGTAAVKRVQASAS
jgi:hypothetical protein